MSITVVFDTPQPSDTPAVFNLKAFQALADWNEWSVEANALALAINANKLAAEASQVASAASEAAATTKAAEALASKIAAELAETNAEAAQTAAASSAAAASISESGAAVSAGTATTKAAEASASKIAAELAEMNAEAASAAALLSQTAASASEAAADISETNAANSASAATTKASEALASKIAAELAEANAEAAQVASAISQGAAAVSAAASEASKLDSQAARDKAQQWADAPLNAQVEAGQYSAKHWAQQAQATVTGQLVYRGGHDASTGAYPASPFKGDYWKIAVGGTVSGVVLAAGDSIIYNGATWDKIDSTDQVSSVAGRTGDVVLGKGDVGLGNVDNTPDYAKNVARATATAVGDSLGRDANALLPTASPQTVRFDFVSASSTATGGNYAGLMTFSPWTGTTASTGDASYQLAFGSTVTNGGGIPQLRLRKGIDSAWGAWLDVVTTANVATLGASNQDWVNSDRHFPNGTLITTSIDYTVSNGDPWVLEIKGNSYGGAVPLDLKAQGYIYSDTMINVGGFSNGTGITGMVAINHGGKLCFWFPSQGYWQGYSVRVYRAFAGRFENVVTAITDTAQPTSAKLVDISAQIRQSLHSSNFTSYAAPASHSHDYATHRPEGTNFIDHSRYTYDNGAYDGAPRWVEPSDLAVRYARYGRLVYNNGAWGGSGWVEPSDLGVRYAQHSQRANGNFYIDENYGYTLVGAYASTRYQGVYAMGDSYKLPADGTTTGNLYGLAWAHPNAGGAAGNLDSHGLLLLINGGFGCALSYSIVASGNVTAYSDERLKTNWRPMPEDYVGRLAKVKVGIYDRIDASESNRLAAEAAEAPGDELVTDAEQVVPIPVTQVGVGAQSFQELLPEAINTANDEMGTLSVAYGNAALASCVELAKELVSLRQEIENLKLQLKGA